MTANSPLKTDDDGTPPEDGDGPGTAVRDTRDFMKNLDQELKDFDDQLETLKQSRSVHSSHHSSPPEEPPHFTIDSSPTKNM